MRIEQLQAFLAVVETENFGRAARQCGKTQSTISRQIQALESDLGLPLLHRSSHPKLTLGGERFLPRARRMYQEWQAVDRELSDLLAGKQPELCIAAIHSVCAYYLPPILQDFCRQHPEVQLRVTALGSDRALKVLRDGFVDVAIVMNDSFLAASPEMVVEPLYDEPIEVLMAAEHPLAQYEQLSWPELARYPHAAFKEGYGMQRLVQAWFTRRDATLQTAMELNTLDAFRGVVRQGELISLLPRGALVEARNDPSLAIRPIAAGAEAGTERTLTRQVVLATTRDRLQIPPVSHFTSACTQQPDRPSASDGSA